MPSRPQSYPVRIGALALLAALALGACTPRLLDFEPARKGLITKTHRQADALVAEDRAEDAASLLWRTSAELRSPQRELMRVSAVRVLVEAGILLRAQALLPRIDEAPLDAKRLLRKRLLEARLHAQTGRPGKMLDALPLALIEQGDPRDQAQALPLAAEAAFETGLRRRAIRLRILLDPLLEGDARRGNHFKLWRYVAQTPPPALAAMLDGEPDRKTRAWLELGQLATPETIDLDALRQSYANWRARHSWAALPASVGDELEARWNYLDFEPGEVALLLPLTGSYGGLGRSVQNGFMAAARATTPDFAVRVYNTDRAQGVEAIYAEAVANGAGMVVGPLLKDNVARLFQNARGATPIMSMNYYAGDAAPASGELFQFGLLPEDEARQVARRLLRDGHLFVAALAPDDAWGERLLESFAEEYRSLGGELRAVARYDPSFVDYSAVIERLFRLQASRARGARVAQIIGRQVEFSPRIREDISAAALFADHARGVMIYPQMKYHYVDQLPVYASSHIYRPAGEPQRELDGLLFCDAPLLVRGPAGGADDAYPRLYALGADAFALVKRFRQMALANRTLPGLSGELSIGPGNRLFRKLDWAKIVRGRPQRLPDDG